jgi:hypothetical protein
MFGFGQGGKCEHEHTTDLNEFDGDGNIVTNKIKCNKCNKENAKVYEAVQSQTIWNDQNKCAHHMFKIDSYKKLPNDQILCEVHCMLCTKTGTNLYNLDGLSVNGWNDFD